MSCIRVVVATRDRAVLDMCRMAFMLDSRFNEIARVPDAGSLFEALNRLGPNLVVLDARLCPDPESIASIRASSHETSSLVVTGVDEPRLVARLLEQGAQGCVTRDCSPESLVRAMEAVSRGELWASRRVLAKLLARLIQPAFSNALSSATNQDDLTEREKEILHWVSRGMTNKEVARLLGISDLTVKSHLQNIYAKLGVHRRVQVVLERIEGFP